MKAFSARLDVAHAKQFCEHQGAGATLAVLSSNDRNNVAKDLLKNGKSHVFFAGCFLLINIG